MFLILTLTQSFTMALLTEEEREVDPYEVLGVDITASSKDVQRAYRKKALKCHPDKVCFIAIVQTDR